jgi:hypothetical protein
VITTLVEDGNMLLDPEMTGKRGLWRLLWLAGDGDASPTAPGAREERVTKPVLEICQVGEADVADMNSRQC